MEVGVGAGHAHEAVLLNAGALGKIVFIIIWFAPTVIHQTELLHYVRRSHALGESEMRDERTGGTSHHYTIKKYALLYWAFSISLTLL